MKRFFGVTLMALALGGGLLGFSTPAHALDANAAFNQLKTDLQGKGLAVSDINAAAQSVKTMLNLGASPGDMKNLLLDFSKKGFKGNDLGKLSGMVSELMKSRMPVKGAEGVVSQAVKRAEASGLKGKELIAKVQSVVNEKKAQLDQLKSIAAAKKSQAASEVEKAKKGFGSVLGQ